MQKELDRQILASCAEGHVELNAMIAQVAKGTGDVDPASARAKAMAVITLLLEKGLIRAGRPTPDGKAFVAWSLEAKEAIARIRRETPGDSVWFAATKEGNRVSSKY